MTDWHPVLGSPDPASGWISADTIAQSHREEAEEVSFRRMVERRNRFEKAVKTLDDDADPAEISRLWDDLGADDTSTE